MPIDKVGFSGLDHTLPLSSQSKRDKSAKASTTPSDNEISNASKYMIGASNASKYMIGAAALAGVVALGIIGHKNNWWRKASQAAEDLKPKIPKESPEPPYTPNTHCAEEVNVTNNPQVNNNNASKVESKSSAAGSGNPKPVEQAQEVQTGNTHNVVDTQVDYSDISTIKGDRIDYQDGSVKITQKDESDTVVRVFHSRNGRTVSFVKDYDPKTGKTTKLTYYKDDGRTVSTVTDYNPTGKPTKETYYKDDGRTVSTVTDYNPTTGNPTKKTFYKDDGMTVSSVYDCDPTTGKPTKQTLYNDDGKTVRSVFDCDPKTGNQTKWTRYNDDGITVRSVTDFDPTTGNPTKKTFYNDDGTVCSVYDYDPKTGKPTK